MGLAYSALCCAGSAGCFACSCLSRLCGGKGEQSTDYPAGCGGTGSVALTLVAILLALLGQTWWYDYMDDVSYLHDAWNDDCHKSQSKYPRCREFGATFRVAMVTTLFFLLMAVLSKMRPVLHDYGWDAKFILWSLATFGSLWVSQGVFDEHGYLWFARIGAFIFIILQQVILIDGAYTVNETLFEWGSQPGTEEGGLNKWLCTLLALSAGLFASAFTGIVLLFLYYAECSTSQTILSLALIFIVLFVALQLTSDPDHGHNLLASAVVAAYVSYLSYVSVSSNPSDTCNPNYSSQSSDFMLAVGLGITFCSIALTVFFSSRSMTGLIGENSSHRASPSMTDVLISDASLPERSTSLQSEGTQSEAELNPKTDMRHWRFNMVMALITMYWCCVLTDWGNYKSDSSSASPTAGTTAMWMNAAASWICCLLYTWTLVAPRLYPDRDFS